MSIKTRLFVAFALYLLVAAFFGMLAYVEFNGLSLSFSAEQMQGVHAALKRTARLFISALIIAALLGAVVTYWLSARIANPIRNVEQAMRRIARGDSSDQPLPPLSDEVASLETSFSEMEERIRSLVSSLELAIRNLHEKQGQLVASEKLASLGRISAGVAHEINNPLSIINEKAGLMKDIIDASGDMPNMERFEATVKSILDNVKRCRAITHQLLGYARHMTVTLEEFDLNAALTEVIGYLEHDIFEKKVRLVQKLDPSLPIIRSDRGQLQQVFLNIIKNAIDAIPAGGEVSVTTLHGEDSQVEVRIKDNGFGMHKKVLEHIFEPFFTTKTKSTGTGLGLFISHGIVKQLGGDISASSETGTGTEFAITLPVHSIPVGKVEDARG